MATAKMTGIDVSYWQGNPDLSAFKTFKNAGWDFVIARIGYASGGQRYPDSTFETNYKNSNSAGLRIGAYFYSNARNASEGRTEANYVISLLQGKALNLPIFIDMEDNATSGTASKTNLAAACKAFCETIEAAGYMAGVYASTSWFQSKIGSLGNLSKWVAQYNDRVTYSGDYDMWQYSSTTTVKGFSGRRDVNKCYVGYDDNLLIRPKMNLLIRKGYGLKSKKLGTLDKNGIYRVTKTASNGTRGYIPGKGWVTVTAKYAKVVEFTDNIRVKTKGKLIYRESPLLSSKKKGTLKANTVYIVSRISQDGTRGYVHGYGWITITSKYVTFI